MSDGTTTATATIRLLSSASPALAGSTWMVSAAQQPPGPVIPPFIPQNPLQEMRRSARLQLQQAREQLNNDLHEARRAGEDVAIGEVNRLLDLGMNSNVWIDRNRRLQGMVVLGANPGEVGPVGTLRYDGDKVLMELNYPIRGGQGQVITKRLTWSNEDGLHGDIALSDRTWVRFNHGTFERAQFSQPGELGLTVSYDANGVFSATNSRGFEVQYDRVRMLGGLRIDEHNTLTFTENGFNLRLKDLIDLSFDRQAGVSAYTTALTIGDVGTFQVGYDTNRRLLVGGTINLPETTISFLATPVAPGNSRMELTALYRALGSERRERGLLPQGVARVSLLMEQGSTNHGRIGYREWDISVHIGAIR